MDILDSGSLTVSLQSKFIDVCFSQACCSRAGSDYGTSGASASVPFTFFLVIQFRSH